MVENQVFGEKTSFGGEFYLPMYFSDNYSRVSLFPAASMKMEYTLEFPLQFYFKLDLGPEMIMGSEQFDINLGWITALGVRWIF